jgi:hypothetical protein
MLRSLRLMTLLAASGSIALVVFVRPTRAETVDAGKVYVIDGDTVAVARERIRLLGIDAPETREARCERERVAGYRTKARIVDLLPSANPSTSAGRGTIHTGEHSRESLSMAEIWASNSCARIWPCPTERAQKREPIGSRAGAAREAPEAAVSAGRLSSLFDRVNAA